MFGHLERKLGSLAENPQLKTEEVSGLLEDLRETIFDHQVCPSPEDHFVGFDTYHR